MSQSKSNKQRKVEQRLDALYATLPKIECQGKCVAACGPISVTPAEWRRMTEANDGVPPSYDGKRKACTLLTADGKCSVYAERPFICRLYGAVDNERMRCAWGCKPERYLTEQEGIAFYAKVEKATGNRGYVETLPGLQELLRRK